MNIQTSNTNPNFTIVLPGPCNATCSFCTWEEDDNSNSFLNGLEYALNNLPIMFQQISISGGEPTLSPYLRKTLKLISKYRHKFKKVVLTTNAVKLFTDPLYNGISLKELYNIVDHINISRHSSIDHENYQVFGNSSVPSTEELTLLSNRLNNSRLGENTDLNYNCVLTDEVEQDPVKWIKFMKSTNIRSVVFRNQYNDDTVSSIEQQFIDSNIVPQEENECPVCKTTVYFTDDGYKFKFHKSVYEPIKIFNGLNIMNETYEVILQSSGNLTRDWEGKSILYNAYATPNELAKNSKVLKHYEEYPEEIRIQIEAKEEKERLNNARREESRLARLRRVEGVQYSSCGNTVSSRYSSCG